jgi:transcriptional regulator with XRE-family HTH domain
MSEVILIDVADYDRQTIMRIATKAKTLRKELGYSYESFAMHANINRNTYFKFEKSSVTGDNFTIGVMLKVIKGLGMSLETFFQEL